MTSTPIRAHEVTLAPVRAWDLPVLADLYVQLDHAHGGTITADAASSKLSKSLQAGLRAILFKYRHRALGFVIWADMGDHAFIRNFVIDRSVRSQGLGAALFTRVRNELLAPGTAIRLETSNADARRFWEAQGLTAWSTGMRLDPPGRDEE